MSTSFYVYETQYKHLRKCYQCGSGMSEGYLHEETSTTFCSVICVAQMYGVRGAAELVGRKELFYTDWYDEVEGLE